MSKSLSEKVDWLFEHRLTGLGRQHTYGSVQRATSNRITASYVWKLRTGAMHNPGLHALETLADFFNVPLGYFANGGEYMEPSLTVTKKVSADKTDRDCTLELLEEKGSTLSHDNLLSSDVTPSPTFGSET